MVVLKFIFFPDVVSADVLRAGPAPKYLEVMRRTLNVTKYAQFKRTVATFNKQRDFQALIKSFSEILLFSKQSLELFKAFSVFMTETESAKYDDMIKPILKGIKNDNS